MIVMFTVTIHELHLGDRDKTNVTLMLFEILSLWMALMFYWTYQMANHPKQVQCREGDSNWEDYSLQATRWQNHKKIGDLISKMHRSFDLIHEWSMIWCDRQVSLHQLQNQCKNITSAKRLAVKILTKMKLNFSLSDWKRLWFTWGMVKNRLLMGGALIESMKVWKQSAESKKPDISWHFAIVSFGSINIEGCVPRAALLRKIYFQVHDLSQIGSLGTCTRQWAGSRKHFTFRSVECIVF